MIQQIYKIVFLTDHQPLKRGVFLQIFIKMAWTGKRYVAWPVKTMMAFTWNEELLYAFGDAVGAECEYMQINVWLSSAINLHRNPIAGRNFSYFSEDTFLSERMLYRLLIVFWRIIIL